MTEPSKEELDAAVKGALAEEVETSEEATPEYSEVELEAIEHGWNPEGVEGRRNLTAEEFLDRQPLYDDLRKTKRQIRKQQEQIDALKKHLSTADVRAKERAIAELQAQKKQALIDEDYDSVVAIDEQIAEAKSAPTLEEPQGTPEAFEEWRESNEWYDDNPEMREYADMIGNYYTQKHPNEPVEKVFEHVTKEVKERFSKNFKNPRREAPSSVESASRSGRAAPAVKRYSVNDLPEEHREIMKTLVRGGTMTKEEYLRSYFGDE